MIKKIVVVMDGEEVTLSMNDARALYKDLKELFESEQKGFIPDMPDIPWRESPLTGDKFDLKPGWDRPICVFDTFKARTDNLKKLLNNLAGMDELNKHTGKVDNG